MNSDSLWTDCKRNGVRPDATLTVHKRVSIQAEHVDGAWIDKAPTICAYHARLAPKTVLRHVGISVDDLVRQAIVADSRSAPCYMISIVGVSQHDRVHSIRKRKRDHGAVRFDHNAQPRSWRRHALVAKTARARRGRRRWRGRAFVWD